MIMKSMVVSITIMIISVMFAGYFLVIGIMFLIAITSIARIIARSVARVLILVTVTIRIVLSMARVSIMSLIIPSFVAIFIIQSVVAFNMILTIIRI